MQINLNNPNALTIQSVRQLIASGSDVTTTQIRVTKDGMAFLAIIDGAPRNLSNIAFRLESLGAGGGWVGKDASEDDAWVSRIYEALKANWPHPTSTYINRF